MKKFDKYIYEKFRERAKLILTGHLGKVVEEDDNIQLNNDNSKLILKRIKLIDALIKVKNKLKTLTLKK